MLPAPHKFAMVLIEAVGGFLTITVCDVWVVPHEFVVVNVIVYVPGSVKLYVAFVVVWLGIWEIVVPQKPGACETDQV
jgi:hypothetical protein